jgi:hypothetical protein
VLDLLSEGSLSTREVSDRLYLNLGHLRSRLLPKLADHGLIVRTENGWNLAPDLDAALARCAEDLGLVGKAEKVAEGHRAERLAYLDHRERTRPERSDRQVDIVAHAVPMTVTALQSQRPSPVVTKHHTEEGAHV